MLFEGSIQACGSGNRVVTQSHGTTGLAREKHMKGPERGQDDNTDLQGVAN